MTRVEGTERNWGESLQTGCRSRSIRADLLGQHARRKPERDGGTRARREGGREGKNLCPHSQTKKKLDRHGLIKMHSAPTNCTPLLPLSCSFPHPLILKAGGKGLQLSDVLGGSVWLPEVMAAIFS